MLACCAVRHAIQITESVFFSLGRGNPIVDAHVLGGTKQVRVERNVTTTYVVFHLQNLVEYDAVVVDIGQFTAHCNCLLHVECRDVEVGFKNLGQKSEFYVIFRIFHLCN